MGDDFESKRQIWSPDEVEATIRAYLKMLKSELDGEHYVKSSSNAELRSILNNRSKAAVEKKLQNISAVLTELNLPYINGYKPLRNVQQILREMVRETLDGDNELHQSLRFVASSVASAPSVDDILSSMVQPPKSDTRGDYFEVREPGREAVGRFMDFLGLEANNASLGNAGEEFILNYEIARLSKAGQDRLAAQIEHVSKTKGDGLGYDILSFEDDGRERLIEVRTKGGIYMPFYLTANELRVSNREKHRYHLFRVFDFRRAPRFFSLKGAIDSNANLEPIQFIGSVI